MNEDDRFRVLDDIDPPDQWDDVVDRIGRPEPAAAPVPGRRVGTLVGVAAVVALLGGAVAVAVVDRDEDRSEDVRTTAPPTTAPAADEGAQLPPADVPLTCPPEWFDISALGLNGSPQRIEPQPSTDGRSYAARWAVGDQTVELQIPVPGVIDLTGERTEQVDIGELWYRGESVQLRVGNQLGQDCTFGVTVYGTDEGADAGLAVDVAENVRVDVTWRPVADTFAAPNSSPISAWTGSEYLYWDGDSTGIGYEPLTGRVRTLAPGPTVEETRRATAWTGTEVLVCCSGSPAAYDPTIDRWRSIDRGPLADATSVVGTWASDRWYVIADGRLASYDPAEDRWEELRRQPLTELGAYSVAWTGELLAVTARLSDAILLYDPTRDVWSRADPPEPGVEYESLVWTGTELVRFGFSSGNDRQTAGDAYEPAADRWRRLADAPLPAVPYNNKRPFSQSVAWTGDAMVVYAGQLGRAYRQPPAMLAYDPGADRWTRLPSLAGAGSSPDLVWAGDRVLLRADRLYELPLTGG